MAVVNVRMAGSWRMMGMGVCIIRQFLSNEFPTAINHRRIEWVVPYQLNDRLSATANVANVSVRETFAPGTAAVSIGPTEPQVTWCALTADWMDVCGWEIRTVGM